MKSDSYTTHRKDWGAYYVPKDEITEQTDEIIPDISLLHQKKLLVRITYHIAYKDAKKHPSIFVGQVFENIINMENGIDREMILKILNDNQQQHLDYLRGENEFFRGPFLQTRDAKFRDFILNFEQVLDDFLDKNNLK